jgi:hypothetical protein
MVSWRAESLTTGTFPIEARKAKAFDRFCTGPEKPESRDGCVSRDAQLTAAKSPTPDFQEKCGNCPDISKGISQSGIYRFESSEVSHALRQFTTRGSQARKSGLFAHSTWSPGSRSRNLRQWRKVSGRFPKNSRFAETIGGDRFESVLVFRAQSWRIGSLSSRLPHDPYQLPAKPIAK